jgi:hypothetical protein
MSRNIEFILSWAEGILAGLREHGCPGPQAARSLQGPQGLRELPVCGPYQEASTVVTMSSQHSFSVDPISSSILGMAGIKTLAKGHPTDRRSVADLTIPCSDPYFSSSFWGTLRFLVQKDPKEPVLLMSHNVFAF